MPTRIGIHSWAFEAWALWLAKSRVIDHYRVSGREKLVFSEQLMDQFADSLIARQSEQSERGVALEKCVEKLPDKSRLLLELRYEDLFYDQDNYWPRQIFQHYGFSGPDLERCIDIMDGRSYAKIIERGGKLESRSHIRVGTPGDWVNHFTPRVKEYFKARYGNQLVNLGYADGNNW